MKPVSATQHLKQQLNHKNLVRLLVLLVIIFALGTGYFHASLVNEHNKYLKLEDKYVRVRDQLGREETQRLIDRSYTTASAAGSTVDW